MNRDNHNIAQAYLKSRLLKEQAEEKFEKPDLEKEKQYKEDFEKWEKEYSEGLPAGVYMGSEELLKYYFTKRMDELLDENIALNDDWFDLKMSERREFLGELASHDFIIKRLINKYAKYVSFYDQMDRELRPGDIFSFLYNKYFEKKGSWQEYGDGRDDDQDNEPDDDQDNEPDDDRDDTGQDEPIDTRSYSDVRTSDRSDYANRMVRSGKWDRERAEEYKRGA